MARHIYGATAQRDRDAKKATLARILSVSERTVRDWLSRVDKDAREARDRRIFDMWMACATFDEIAAATDCSATIAKEVVSSETADLPKATKAAADHATDFDAPLYNIWKQQEKTAGSKHFGNSEVRWVDNLV